MLDPADLPAAMQSYVQALGLLNKDVCNYCHVEDRASDEKMQKVIARKMITMVREINAQFPYGKQHVTCYTYLPRFQSVAIVLRSAGNVKPVGPSPNIFGGMGLEGLARLKKFLDDGGSFSWFRLQRRFAGRDSASLPNVSIVYTRALRARGSVYLSNVEDRSRPIAEATTSQLGVYFKQAPVFRVALTYDGGSGGFEPPAARPRGAGRGALTLPDRVLNAGPQFGA